MSKSSLITVLAVIASVSAKPYIYSVGTPPLAQRAGYPAAELYNPAAVAPLSAAYSAGFPVGYPTAYSAGYPTAFSAYSSYPGSYAPLSAAYSASLPLSAVSAYGSYSVEELAPALYNSVPAALAPVASVAPVAPVAPLTYGSPYSYVYKR